MPTTAPTLPTRIDAERIYLRSYQEGDGPWLYAMALKNRNHLMRYEADNVVLSVDSEEEAENIVRELAAEWSKLSCFFAAVFDRESDEFVAQLYIGPVNWEVPEFEIGFFADKDHEGQGYVSEAVWAAFEFVFVHLKANRVRMECDDTNLRSVRVAERCQLVKEGWLRENKRNVDGSLSGTYLFGLLKSEYEAMSKIA